MCDKYFTDTNVGIAYAFYPDKFHPSVKEKIEKGGNGMPGGLVPAEKLDDMAKWVSEIK